MKRVLLRCLEPDCRDALEETARLALTYITVTTTPGYSEFQAGRDLQVHLSAQALSDGCHLPEMAHDLLEALQAHGVVVARVADFEAELSEEWQDWWSELNEAAEFPADLVLDIK